MKKIMLSALSCVLGVAASHTAAAYTLFSEIAFCPQSDTVIGHCQLDLSSLDLYNFIGGITDECYISKNNNIVADAKFNDGNTATPIGRMIETNTAAHLFPNVQPMVNFREYCAKFEDIALWRFVTNSSGYVIKNFIIDYEQVQTKFSHCDTHETGR